MTESEKAICKAYLEDLDKDHTCNKYKLLMELLNQEPCEDYISRQKAIDAAMKDVSDIRTHDFNAGATRAANRIAELPPVQPARRKGKWILAENGWNTICDFCGNGKWKGYIPTPEEAAEWMPICPQCGADMRESEE